MKRKIALFASGWASQILSQFLKGLSESLKNSSTDTYLFLCYPSWTTSEVQRHGEFNILRLPHLEDFDLVIIISNGLEFNNEISFLFDKCRESKTPSISIGIKAEGLYYLGIDNKIGMQELCNHLINCHHIKSVMFLAGSKDNPDSQLRCDVVNEMCKKNNIPFSEENIFYTNWENFTTSAYINSWCDDKKPLPDVFICANDGIAMNVCLALNKFGYSVPKDTLVTGFDNVFDGQVFSPAISSVNQSYETIGKESGKLFFDLLNGVEREKELIIPCKFIANESCCSEMSSKTDKLRRDFFISIYSSKSEDTILERKLNHIERFILTGEKFDDLKINLADTLANQFAEQGNSFHMVLEPSYGLSIFNPTLPLRTNGYSSAMEIAFSQENGKISCSDFFKSRNLIPDHVPDDKEHLYVFIPLHSEDKSLGYFILSDCYKQMDRHFIQKYQQRFITILERHREKLILNELNLKLTEITRIDPLTHVKNRMAYETREKELDTIIKTGKKINFGIVMFDINNLKKINDALGHDIGDIYICNSCRMICKIFAHTPIFRIGGDEFLGILQNEDLTNKTKLLTKITKQIKELSKADISEEEKVSIACGAAIFNPEKDTSVQDVFKRADSIMYKNKANMKGCKAR